MDAIISFLHAAIIAGTPLLFATLGEVITERAGNLNLGVEGMMLMGAVMGFMVGLNTGNAALALLTAMIAGACGAFIFAFLTVTLRANQIVTGLTLTIFGSGFADFVGQDMIGKIAPEGLRMFFRPYSIPLLGDIPFIGPVLFRQDAFVYLGYITAVLLGVYLYKTSLGMNLRAVGENPGAADAAGINVAWYKYVHTLVGGALCGLGGAYLSLVYVPALQEGVTAGRGWIAVALVIFATWNPYKAIIGSFLFGGLDIIGFRMQSLGINVSQYFIDMLPYLVTITVLVVVSMRKSKEKAGPKACGLPYFREER